MTRSKWIGWGSLSALATAAAIGLLSSVTHGEGDGQDRPVEPSKPFVSDATTDTLAAEVPSVRSDRLDHLKREVMRTPGQAVSPMLLAETGESTDPRVMAEVDEGAKIVETFPLAEVRTGAVDDRFDLAVSRVPRSVDAEVPESAVAAVTTGPAGAGVLEDQPTPESLVRRIESLRSGQLREGEANESPDLEVPEPLPAKPAADAPTPGRASETGTTPVFAWGEPARSQRSIGSQVSEATLATESEVVSSAGYPASANVFEEEAGPAVDVPFTEIAVAAPPVDSPERKGILGRFFGRKKLEKQRAAQAEAAAAASRSTLETFPLPNAPRTKASKAEDRAQEMIDQIYGEYVTRVSNITASDLSPESAKGLPSVPGDFDTVWMSRVRRGYWVGVEPIAVRLEEIYARALINSNRVRVYGFDPLIRETAIQEAEGAFDLEAFLNGSYGQSDDPTSSILDTGEIGRFLENRGEADAGLRRRFATGAQVTLSNRFLTLSNNSEFTQPNPQTGSTLVLSVVQPLLRGGGYHYNKARLKVAKIDSGVAASEYIQQLEAHLLEVNRAYWEVYFARAGYLLRKDLVGQTEEIVEKLEARSDEATASELLRARSELSRRRTGLNRAELAIRNAEERLRSLVNDPEFPIGGEGEFVPITSPVLNPPRETVHGAAMEAVDNRAEIAASFGELRVAAIRDHAGKHEKMPQLDLLAESRMAGLERNRRVGRAYDDMFSQDASWLVGFQFSQPWENNFAKSREERLKYELLRQADVVRTTMDDILLESVVTYRELITTYRDLQGNLQQVLSTREEVKGLKERLDIDAGAGQPVGYRLQNILDAMDRNQVAEEQFLVSVVTYNMAFAALERSKGTFLKFQGVSIERSESEQDRKLEQLRAIPSVPVSSGAVVPKGAK